MSPDRTVAYVLPVYDEAENVAAFHRALVAATDERPDLRFEFVYVDDGSGDGSLDRLLELRHDDPRVTVLALSRNFGHQVAVTAGLDAATGADAVVVMDTDLQDPPGVSLELIRVWEKGVDVVYAQRRTREHDRFLRGIVAHVGFRQEAVLFDRDARHLGTTGYPLRKMLAFATSGILGFSTLPLRLISRL